MSAIFRPAIQLMNRLRYPQKFALVGLVLLLPLLLVMVDYLGATNTVISFASKEQLGLTYNAPLVQLLVDLEEHWSLTNATIATNNTAFQDKVQNNNAAIKADLDAVDKVDAQVGSVLGVHADWTAFKTKFTDMENMMATMMSMTTISDSLTMHSQLGDQLTRLIVEVGNNSNLILDPDIDTYYSMDDVINKLPELINRLGQIGAYGVVSAMNQTVSDADRTRLSIFSELSRATLSSSLLSYGYAFDYNPTYKADFQPQVNTYSKAVGSFLDSLNAVVSDTSKPLYTSATLFDSVDQTLKAVYLIYEGTSPRLNALLQARIDRNVSQRNLAIAVALVALALTIYLFVGFY